MRSLHRRTFLHCLNTILNAVKVTVQKLSMFFIEVLKQLWIVHMDARLASMR